LAEKLQLADINALKERLDLTMNGLEEKATMWNLCGQCGERTGDVCTGQRRGTAGQPVGDEQEHDRLGEDGVSCIVHSKVALLAVRFPIPKTQDPTPNPTLWSTIS